MNVEWIDLEADLEGRYRIAALRREYPTAKEYSRPIDLPAWKGAFREEEAAIRDLLKGFAETGKFALGTNFMTPDIIRVIHTNIGPIEISMGEGFGNGEILIGLTYRDHPELNKAISGPEALRATMDREGWENTNNPQ